MNLRRDLVLLPFDGAVVAFSEEAQCLVGLNPTAALVVSKVLDGTSFAAMPEQLVAQGLASPPQAGEWVTTVRTVLEAHGLLCDAPAPPARPRDLWNEDDYLARMAREMPPYVPAAAAIEARYRLLDTCALIRFGHLAQLRLVNAVIGHLAVDDSAVPTVTLDIQARPRQEHLHSNIYREGRPIAYAARLSRLGPVLKSAFWSTAINAHDFLFYIHAGVVGTAAGCLLLPAAPGSGKSSLTAALTHRGLSYFSDEIALLEPGTFHVAPMPLAFCIKSTGWDLMASYYPQLQAVPTHWRADGKIVRYVAPPPERVQRTPAPVSHIIFPHYDPDGGTELSPITRSDALRRLMEECLAMRHRLRRESVDELTRWIEGIDCYALTFSSLERATDLISRVTLAA